MAHSRTYVPGNSVEEQLEAHLRGTDPLPLTLIGAAGTGKTAFVLTQDKERGGGGRPGGGNSFATWSSSYAMRVDCCRLLSHLVTSERRRADGMPCVLHFVGCTSASRTLINLLQVRACAAPLPCVPSLSANAPPCCSAQRMITGLALLVGAIVDTSRMDTSQLAASLETIFVRLCFFRDRGSPVQEIR